MLVDLDMTYIEDYFNFFFWFVDLYLLYRGTCRKLKFIDACPKKLKFEKSVLPVCGSDKKSYTSIQALNCARSRINKGKYFTRFLKVYGKCIINLMIFRLL